MRKHTSKYKFIKRKRSCHNGYDLNDYDIIKIVLLMNLFFSIPNLELHLWFLVAVQ
jgi:hypothetical protein